MLMNIQTLAKTSFGHFTLFLLRGDKSGPDDKIHSGICTFWQLESPNFMNLFLFTFARSLRGHFLKKENQFLKNPKELVCSFNIKGSPLWIRIWTKKLNFSLFWKKMYFCTRIWIRNVFSFLLMYISHLLLRISNFVIFCLKNIIFDLCHSGACNSKRRLYSDLVLVSTERKRGNA